MSSVQRITAPVHSTNPRDSWPAWTDADRWGIGPDGEPDLSAFAEPAPADSEWWSSRPRAGGCGEQDLSPEERWIELCMTSDEWYERLAEGAEIERRYEAGHRPW